MAADREIIREFLVALGYHVDEPSARKFLNVLVGSSKLAAKTSAAVVGVAAAAEGMVQVFARSMEKMYYSSQRTKASVGNIQALKFGFEQVGLSADEAVQTLENFSRGLRLNPGLKALLNSLGVKVEGRDRVQVLYDLVENLAKMPHFVGAQFAEQFGMDENTFLMMKSHLKDLRAAEEKRLEMQKRAGFGAQQAASDSRIYMNTLRELWERVEIVSQTIAHKLLPYFQEFSAAVNEMIQDLQKWVNKGLKLDLGQWGGQIHDIYVDLKAIVDLVQSDVPNKWNSFFWALGVEARAAAHAVLDLIDSVLALAHGDYKKAYSKLVNVGKYLLYGPATPKSEAEQEVDRLYGGKAPRGIRQNNPGNLRYWGGADHEGGFAKFGSMNQGLSAMAGQLLLYYDRDRLKTVKDIISKYAPSSENNTAGYISRVASALGVGSNQQIDLHDPRILTNLMMAMTRVEQGGVMPFGYRDALNAAKSRLGSNVTMHNNTTIHVHGGDAAATGRAVAGEQSRVYADTLRNVVGAVQ